MQKGAEEHVFEKCMVSHLGSRSQLIQKLLQTAYRPNDGPLKVGGHLCHLIKARTLQSRKTLLRAP